MSLLNRCTRLVTRYRIAHAIFYALSAFLVIFALDLLWHYGSRWDWFWERLTRAFVEAAAVGILAAHLAHLREQRIFRRQRAAAGYLNHHVRNGLALIHAAELMEAQKQAAGIRRASQRICMALEQFSRDEHVAIDEQEPERVSTTTAA